MGLFLCFSSGSWRVISFTQQILLLALSCHNKAMCDQTQTDMFVSVLHKTDKLVGRIEKLLKVKFKIQWSSFPKDTIRSSAQGNCSAKSLAASVMSSILPCSSILPGPPYPPPVMLSLGRVWPWGSGHGGVWPAGVPQGGRGVPQGGGGSHRGRGQGTFWSSCHILHYHVVLRPEGTSHNYKNTFQGKTYSNVFNCFTSIPAKVVNISKTEQTPT